MSKRGKSSTNTQWTRNCPSCNKEMCYSSKGNLDKAIRANRKCMNCKNVFTPEYIEKLSKANSGKTYSSRLPNIKTQVSKFDKICPTCGNVIYYSCRYALTRSIKANSVCNSCSSYAYNKTFNDVITKDHINQMAATKAGYSTYDEYKLDYPRKKLYYRIVRSITKKQPIQLLADYDKLTTGRGRNGKINAYQLDHIISIDEGYRKNIDPMIIGDIRNLQILSWQKNIARKNTTGNSFVSWISSLVSDVKFNYTLPGTSHTSTVFIPTYNVAIDYVDINWDGEFRGGPSKLMSLKKRNAFVDAGVKFIQLYSSEWVDRTQLIKSKISYILKINTNLCDRISARKLEVKPITSDTSKSFLESYHIQGFTPSSVYIGSYYESKLVSVMSFSKNRIITGNKIEDGSYELVRYAVCDNTIIPGGFSKSLTHFIRLEKPNKIYSYANLRFSDEKSVYSKAGFSCVGTTQPGYYYAKNGKLIHRYKFRKSNLIAGGHDASKSESEITKEMGYDRIWDCGHLKYELIC